MLLLLVGCDHAVTLAPASPEPEPDPPEQIPAAPDWEACPEPPTVHVNELVAANIHGIVDAAGDTPDWIELAADAAVDLDGWTLADDSRTPWALPSVTLSPDAPLLVYATGEDR